MHPFTYLYTHTKISNTGGKITLGVLGRHARLVPFSQNIIIPAPLKNTKIKKTKHCLVTGKTKPPQGHISEGNGVAAHKRPAGLLFKMENGEPFTFTKEHALRCLRKRHVVTGRIKFTSAKISWKAFKICPMYQTDRCLCMGGKGYSTYASLSRRSVMKVIELMRGMDDPLHPGEKMWKKEWEY